MDKQRNFTVTRLGDSLHKSPINENPYSGVRNILKNNEMEEAVRNFAMESFPLRNLSTRAPATEEEKRLQLELKKISIELEVEKKKNRELSERLVKEKSEALEEGFAKGNHQGMDEKEKELKDQYALSISELTATLESAFESLAKEVPQLFLQFEKESAQLAMGCVKKVFEEMAENGEGVISVVKKAVEVLGKSKVLTIKVNPEDFKPVNGSQPLWLPLSKKVEQLKIEEEDRVPRGSCIVESNTTSVEMNLDAILNNMQQEVGAMFRAKAAKLKLSMDVSDATPPVSKEVKNEGTKSPEKPEQES